MLAPGDYPSGLKITISDSEHRAMEHTLTTAQLTAGKATSVTLKYAPDADLVFYESFDNFVWGGNIMGGQESTGYARRPKPSPPVREPDATAMRTPSRRSPTTTPARRSSSRTRGTRSAAKRSARPT